MKPIWSIQHTERLTGFIFLEAELFRNVSCNFYKHNIESWLLLSGSTTLEASFLDAFNLHLAHGFLMALLLSCAPQLIGLHTHCAKASNKMSRTQQKTFQISSGWFDFSARERRVTKYLLQIQVFLYIYACILMMYMCVLACVTTHSAVSPTGQDPQVVDFAIQFQATRLTVVNGLFSQTNLTSLVDMQWFSCVCVCGRDREGERDLPLLWSSLAQVKHLSRVQVPHEGLQDLIAL